MERRGRATAEAASQPASQPGQHSCCPQVAVCHPLLHCTAHPRPQHKRGMQPHWRIRRRHSSPAAPSAHEPTAELSPSHRPAAAAGMVYMHASIQAQASTAVRMHAQRSIRWRGIGRRRQAAAAAAGSAPLDGADGAAAANRARPASRLRRPSSGCCCWGAALQATGRWGRLLLLAAATNGFTWLMVVADMV